MGVLDKLRSGLARSRQSLFERVTRLVSGRASIDQEMLDRLEEILIGSDVGAGAAGAIIAEMREGSRAESDHSADAMALLRASIRHQLSAGSPPATSRVGHDLPARPYVILVVGINGAGKTTSIGKLARAHVREGRSVLIAASDTFRAAANEQLEVWAQRAGAQMIRQERGSDPASVAYDAVESAIAHGCDVLLIDTAGRLHTKLGLMEELKKIRRVIQKKLPEAPHEVLLVIDATTGQNGLQQAKQFGDTVGVTGIVLTKLDGTAKGGIVLAIARELGIPVRYVGIGEQVDDLEAFDADMFVEALLGT